MHEGSGSCSLVIDPQEQLAAAWFGTIPARGMVCRGALECEQYYLVRVIKSIKNKYKERQKNGQYKMFQD